MSEPVTPYAMKDSEGESRAMAAAVSMLASAVQNLRTSTGSTSPAAAVSQAANSPASQVAAPAATTTAAATPPGGRARNAAGRFISSAAQPPSGAAPGASGSHTPGPVVAGASGAAPTGAAARSPRAKGRGKKSPKLGRVGAAIGGTVGAIIGMRGGKAGSVAGRAIGSKIGGKVGNAISGKAGKAGKAFKNSSVGAFTGRLWDHAKKRGESGLWRVRESGMKVFDKGKKIFTAKNPKQRGKALADTAVAVYDFAKSIREAAKAALEVNRKYAEVSASMAGVMAELDAKQMFRDMRIGEATSKSAKYLAESENRNQDLNEPWDKLGNKIDNYISGWLNNRVGDLKDGINYIAGKVGLIEENTRDNEERAATMYDLVEDLERQADSEKKEADKRRDTVRKANEKARKR